jgi:demethylmenaquinone methyltransferase/2-methoxy-6-polyprenyl-1,4-benzoquinol methylase
MRFDEYSYGTIARFYDWLAGVYSRGQIAASKRGQLDEIECGDRVLYAGVGTGQDALRAVRAGARVTAIDLAPEMLERFAKQLAREDLDAELVCGDVSVYKPSGLYDVVVANYFLNLFDVEHAREMLRHLCERAITEIYYRPVNWSAWALGFCALHPILDYARLLEPMGFRVRSERRLPVFLGANPAYVSIVGRRVLSGQRASAPPSA